MTMPDFIPKTITALGGAKGIIALLVFFGINGGWFTYLSSEQDYTSKVEQQVGELAVMASKRINHVEVKCTLDKCLNLIP